MCAHTTTHLYTHTHTHVRSTAFRMNSENNVRKPSLPPPPTGPALHAHTHTQKYAELVHSSPSSVVGAGASLDARSERRAHIRTSCTYVRGAYMRGDRQQTGTLFVLLCRASRMDYMFFFFLLLRLLCGCSIGHMFAYLKNHALNKYNLIRNIAQNQRSRSTSESA